jgi:hypothetical protein
LKKVIFKHTSTWQEQKGNGLFMWKSYLPKNKKQKH